MHNLQDQDPAMEAAEIQAASDMLSNLQARADSVSGLTRRE